MGDAGVMRESLENWFEYFPTLSLIGECFVGFLSDNRQRKGMENRRFAVIRIGGLEGGHFLLEGLSLCNFIFSICAIDFAQGINVRGLAGRSLRVNRRNLSCFENGFLPGRETAVVPQTVVM
jgi:hypothetical protein